jgi:hypothetical protein
MGLIDRSLRLLDTQQAGLGVWLAVLLVLAAVVAILLERPTTLFGRRPTGGRRVMIVLGGGMLAAVSVLHLTYLAWYEHRCVAHSSDIPECASVSN